MKIFNLQWLHKFHFRYWYPIPFNKHNIRNETKWSHCFISLIRRVDCIYMEGIDFMWFWRLVNSSWSNQFSYGFDKCSERKNCIGISLANMFCGWKRQSFSFPQPDNWWFFCMSVLVYFGVVSPNAIKALFKYVINVILNLNIWTSVQLMMSS